MLRPIEEYTNLLMDLHGIYEEMFKSHPEFFECDHRHVNIGDVLHACLFSPLACYLALAHSHFAFGP